MPAKIKAISYSQRYIGDHQIDAQEALVECELIRLELQMSMSSTGEVFEFRDQLHIIKQSLKSAREDLHMLPVGRKWLWQRLRIMIYEWSIQDRFK